MVPIDSVVVGVRYRKEMGDLAALAESIATEGLLQPLAVTETLELVAGERRLRACESLGWKEIPVHEVSVTSIVAGEYAENIVRKDFTASERLHLADAIKTTIGDRQGQRTDVGAKKQLPADIPQVAKARLPGNLPEVSRGTETRVIAAKLAGFSSETIMRDARDVVEQGAPELVEAMDAGVVPISVAHELLALAPEAQVTAVKGGRLRVQEAARELRRDKARKRDQVVPRARLTAVVEGTYPCTFSGCPRGEGDPFLNPGRLANHRSALHQIRSTNFDSVQRQARRDRLREEQAANDAIAKGASPKKHGALDRGERELLRKRLVHFVAQFGTEIQKKPDAVIQAIDELIEDDIAKPLTAARLKAIDSDRSFATGAR
jgi:hypothetical protein